MSFLPEFATFEAEYSKGQNQVVYTRLPSDLDTPVSLLLKLTEGQKDSFMLESVTGGEIRGRYSIIGMKPDLIWECRGTNSRINRNARIDRNSFEDVSGDPLTALRCLVEESQITLPDDLPPMASGLFGYLGYDMIRLVEHLPNVNPDPLNLPDAVMLRPTVVVVVDGVKNEVTLVCTVFVANGQGARAAYNQAAERLSDAVRDMERSLPEIHSDGSKSTPVSEPVSNTTKDEYFGMVEKAKDYIRAGDIFQVVPSQRWSQDFDLPPLAFYRALRRTNPSPYMFFFNFGAFQVAGASPETLVSVRDEKVTIRPIAGTRKRGETPAEDDALEADLLADPKELAEHLMLLDLGRNDVGRVAKTGTVVPTAKFTIERYSHVMHIVSNEIGELADDQDSLSALLAGLPAGTMSGVPKVRAMQIIDELEHEKRGVYAGGVGYFAANGDMDLCIALRTAVLKDKKLYIQAGGGVVYDSDPEAEFQETVNTSNVLRQAAKDAARIVKLRNF